MPVSTKSASTRRPKGCFVGLSTVDIIFALDAYPEEDTKNTARQCSVAAGGPASNAAVVFSFLGGDAQLISSLGTGGISDIARRDLAHYCVQHIDLTEDRAREPALSAIAIAGNSGSRTIITSPAINEELTGPFVRLDVSTCIARADVLLLDGHQTKLAGYVARRAKERSVPVVLDGDLYKPDAEYILPLVDIVIFGKSYSVPGLISNKELHAYFHSFGVQYVISTNGGEPIELSSNEGFSCIEVEKVSVVDTLAAGDFFHGAFCYAYSVNRDINRALKFAATVATKSVTQFGTRNWMKGYEPPSVE